MQQQYKFNYKPKTKPYPHQIEAVNYIESHDTVALFDEQGLGKTKIVIEAVCNNIEQNLIEAALIICRKNLINNWQEEIETHSYLKSIVLRGTSREKGNRFMGFAHFYLINYESVPGELERIKMFLGIKKFAIVLDESHAIKNPNSKISENIIQLSLLAIKKIIVSGTPVANKPEDLWNQYFFLDGGKLLGSDFKLFKSRYVADLRDPESITKNENFGELKSLIESNSIRRKKKDVLELPEKKFIDKSVILLGKQEEMYNQLRDELYIEIQSLSGEIIIDQSEDILKKLLRLAQIASNPKLIDQSYNETPVKFPLLDSIIREIINKGEKVIVWSCFVDNIIKLSKVYEELGSQKLHGEMPIDRRNVVIKKFKEDRESRILFANPAAAKEGLTLTVANNAIYLDRNFNLVDYLQSQDRIHRISQSKECNIYKLIAKDTIDEYVDEILIRKNNLAGYIQGDISKLELSNKLEKKDILKFLGSN
jgi:SWI/SNF-related matrix-associated actin-dependent regulator of chromatin subfamily A-like protein 1